MQKIDVTKENAGKIEKLYDNNLVICELSTLKSEKYNYTIIYFPKKNIYDVIVKDNNNKLLNYENRKKLSNSTLKYFKILQYDTYKDNFGNTFKCIKHYIEYED